MPLFRLPPLLLQIVLVFPLLGGFLYADTVGDIAETRENLLEVVRLRESLSNEKRAWREQKELMEGQLALDTQALSILEAALNELRPQLESIQSETTRLTTDLEASDELVNFWTGKLEILKQRVSNVFAGFPPSLKLDLNANLRDVLTLDYSKDSADLKQVFDLCLDIITEANEFHQSIHLLTEVNDLGDGQRREFSVVYLGLSGGYYFSEKSGLAGIILRDGNDWNWVEDNELLDDLLSLGAVLSGQEAPRYLALPMPTEGSVQ
ncbi:MAG: DUF3450 family protein [Verrucomicrobia bacterium]|nr:DUF3450 family protein [Verrucomicrobiota bacterium]MDA1066003.1 DUF3450 family protein [Verrucomicrobiota bacterium]